MLRNSFFRVQNYHQNIPLQGTWYGLESDNSFSIMKDNDVKSTYTSLSRGFGRVKSAFNTEYIVFSKTKNSIYCIDDSGTEHSLFNTSKEMSFICTDNGHILIAEASTDKTQLTVSAYIIVGTSIAPFITLVSTKTISAAISGVANGFMNAIKLDATSGTFCRAYENSTYYSCKATKPAGNGDDLVLEKISGDYNYANVPAAGAKVCVNNNVTTFYNPTLNYYCAVTESGANTALTIYSLNGTQLFTTNSWTTSGITIADILNIRVYLDNSTGNGYITIIGKGNDTSGQYHFARVFSNIYSLNNWERTLIATAAPSDQSPIDICGGGLFPLIQNKIQPEIVKTLYSCIRFNYTTTSVTSSFIDPVPDVVPFGSRILWI